MSHVKQDAAHLSRDLSLTSTLREMKFGAAWIASQDVAIREQFLHEIGEGGDVALPYVFEFWAMPHQLPPDQAWRTWVILGGRGAGKTRAGSEWVRSRVEGALPSDPGECKRVALVGETYDQVREVMIFGDSGIMACSPPDRRPEWVSSRRRLIWPNGTQASVHSAHDAEGLRGPQFDAAWVDELAKWKHGQETWDQLQFALRLGNHPQVCVTTTPRNVPVLKNLLSLPSTVQTHAPTSANRANLAASFIEEINARYAGSRLGRQELEGVLLSDIEGALWRAEMFDAMRLSAPPPLDRIVVAVDPSATSKAASDACGIVVAGAITSGPPSTWRAVVLQDASVQGASPLTWAQAAVDAFHAHDAARLIAEVNQGGEMVETVVRGIDPLIPYKGVHASKGKVARAEPVAALYEQGRVSHLKDLDALEDQMLQMSARGYEGSGSPDRVDALVWALSELLIEPAKTWRNPGVRSL